MKALVVTNLYPTSPGAGRGAFVKSQVEGLRSIGVEVEVLYVDRAGRGRSVYRELGRLVKRATVESAPDVVHVMYGGVTADVVTKSITDRPVVVTYYGSDLLGLPRSASWVRRLSARYGVVASRRAARRASAIIVQSRAMRDALPDGVAGDRISVIPDGVDLDVFAPRDRSSCRTELGWSSSARHVLFPSSRERPEKRYELAEAAVALVNDESRPAELHELRGVGHEQVATWLNAADAVVLTSTHEGSPNAIKEALACNVPVVSVDVGDVAWLIDGVEGCYLAAPEPTDLARKLALALAATERPRSRERMLELSRTRVAERIRAVYESVLVGAIRGG